MPRPGHIQILFDDSWKNGPHIETKLSVFRSCSTKDESKLGGEVVELPPPKFDNIEAQLLLIENEFVP